MGKSALLGYLSERVTGWRVARAVGVESEMELDYAGLHQLCAPMLGNLGRLPAPQRDALATVFGRSSGTVPDRFLVGLAALTLFAEVAEQQPLACLIDDAQWLDQASAQILGFVARRLLAERIALVCAARTGAGDDILPGLPELSIRGLGDIDARALLLANVPGPLDARVCDQIVAESHGNPLALLELPRTWNVADLAGGFGFPSGQPVAGRIEQSYVRRLQLLPSDTQLFVLMAAAEPLGDPVLLPRAAGMLGIDLAAAGPAQDSGLLELGGRVEFAHPLVRSAAYRSAAAEDRRRVHRALADATALAGDANFACPALQMDRWTSGRVPTFAYEFNDDAAPLRFTPPLVGPSVATHGSELQYLFDLPNAPVPGTLSASQQALAASMRTAWANFAASGNPASAAVPWPAFGGGNRPSVLSLVLPQPELETDFSARHHCSFWATR